MISTPITKAEQVVDLFPTDGTGIDQLVQNAISSAHAQLEQIYNLDSSSRTFANTCQALDRATAEFSTALTIVKMLELVSPDSALRESARSAAHKLQEFNIDNFVLNNRLYTCIKLYEQEQSNQELLTEPQKYYIQETLSAYKKTGLTLEPEIQERVKTIKKQLAAHELNFEAHIAGDTKTSTVTLAQLAGLSQDFIAQLPRTQDGKYILGVDYPTYFYVLENCTHEPTRRNLWTAFVSRAYPVNKQELLRVIALRDELAQLLGYGSYAELNIAGQMACSPSVVEGFLFNLLERCQPKIEQEISDLKQDLPCDVMLSSYNAFKPWDMLYIKNAYKKKHFSVDESAISEYFPMEHSLDKMLELYQDFFGIRFKKLDNYTLWHESLQFLEVWNRDNKLTGFIILDLFPREHKFSHAAQETIIPAVKHRAAGTLSPAVAVVMANFPKSRSNKPALMSRNDVSTLFHEFGHALHAVLGATELATQAGTAVKLDFVEMPSQMFEEWLWQPEVLKNISKHYKTGEPLPDNIINNILSIKNFDTGDWVQRQCYLSLLSLEYYKTGAHKDVDAIQRELYMSLRSQLEFYPEDYFYASFGHLMEYGAQYYSYLWSKVFAIDLFDYIKSHGILNRALGYKYVDTILSKGGSVHPDRLLKDFLGRVPTPDAFLRDLGI
jgi:thimet oligopeptidase